ncbi:hypothetical protein NDU88_004734 [Pleurodeles waltl]|uniref:Uncharacterized protein n=1 Tax=Pleurodeles waltl TaxID=8319 RepID=A0AAV7W9U6_PLEWA|nr:hypothetical protein NDU88_004734 [Pleurodeles waltl]
MCVLRHTEERRKAVEALHWWRAVLELRRTRRGAERIPLRGSSSSSSTSEAAGGKKAKSGAPVRSVFRAAEETEAGTVGGEFLKKTYEKTKRCFLYPCIQGDTMYNR